MSTRMAHSRRGAFWLALAVSVAVAWPLLAQEGPHAAIAVTVTDSDGSVVMPGATVTATNALTGKSTRTTTDTDGIGFLHDLQPGTWILKFEREGSATLTRNLHIGAGETNSTTVSLKTADLLALRAGAESQGNPMHENTSDAKRRNITQYLNGQIDLETLETHLEPQTGLLNRNTPESKFKKIMQYLSGERTLEPNQN